MIVRQYLRSPLSPVARGIGEMARRATPASLFSRIAGMSAATDTTCAFQKVTSSEYRLYRPLNDAGYWKEIVYRDGGVSGGPLVWNETSVGRFVRLKTAADPGFVYTGSWTTLGSSDPNSYVGGISRYNATGNSTGVIDVTFDGPGDLYVVFTGRNMGSYFRVDLDGSTDNAVDLPSNGSYRYIDTYTATDLQYKQFAKVATVSAGPHTLKLTATSDRNPANTTGYRTLLEAIAISGEGVYPGTAGTDAPLWQASTAYAQYAQIRTSAGRNYACTVAGTTGSAEPTHTSGTATDGTVTWTYMARSSYRTDSQLVQAAGSELEYAYLIKPSGAAAFEDVGGIAHGNETKTGLAVTVDGIAKTDAEIAANEWLYGDAISVAQEIEVTHSETGATVICDTVKTLAVTSKEAIVSHSHAWNVSAQVGWFYSAMWPVSHWNTEFRYGITRLWTKEDGNRYASDYYGQANPIVGKTAEYLMAGSGELFIPRGTGSAASTLPGKYQFAVALYVTPESVNQFQNDGVTKAGKAMNISGTTPPSFSSTVLKMYFGRADSTNPVSVSPGQTWDCSARYGLSLAGLGESLPF